MESNESQFRISVNEETRIKRLQNRKQIYRQRRKDSHCEYFEDDFKHEVSTAAGTRWIIDSRFKTQVQTWIGHTFDREDIPQLMEAINCSDLSQKHYGLIGMGSIVSRREASASQVIINLGLLEISKEYIKQYEYPQLRLQAIRIAGLTIRLARFGLEDLVLDSGVIEVLIEMLKNSQKIIVEYALKALFHACYVPDYIHIFAEGSQFQTVTRFIQIQNCKLLGNQYCDMVIQLYHILNGTRIQIKIKRGKLLDIICQLVLKQVVSNQETHSACCEIILGACLKFRVNMPLVQQQNLVKLLIKLSKHPRLRIKQMVLKAITIALGGNKGSFFIKKIVQDQQFMNYLLSVISQSKNNAFKQKIFAAFNCILTSSPQTYCIELTSFFQSKKLVQYYIEIIRTNGDLKVLEACLQSILQWCRIGQKLIDNRIVKALAEKINHKWWIQLRKNESTNGYGIYDEYYQKITNYVFPEKIKQKYRSKNDI